MTVAPASWILLCGRHDRSPHLDGPRKYARRVFSALHNRNPHTIFLQYFFDGSRYGLMEKLLGRRVEARPGGGLIVTIGLLRILPFLFRARPALIHCVTFERFLLWICLYRVLRPVPVVYSVHGIVKQEHREYRHPDLWLRFKDWLTEALLMETANTLIFFSQKSRDAARHEYRLRDHKTTIMSHGVDEAFFRISPRSRPNSAPLRVACALGQNKVEKGGTFFVSSMNRVHYPCTLRVAGELPSVPSSRHSVESSSSIASKDMPDWFAEVDVFISSSRFETFSLALIEAMAAGCVVISTRETGASRWIRDGQNGFLVNHGDEEELARMVEFLASHPEERTRLGRAARTTVTALTWDRVMEECRNLYAILGLEEREA